MTTQIYFVMQWFVVCITDNENSNIFCHAMICSMYNIIMTIQIYHVMQWVVISITDNENSNIFCHAMICMYV